jgi:hypothetical protein
VAELDSSVSARTVREWLRERTPNLDQLVFVSWTAQAAIVTTWRVFTEYWDDFCHPASDNVMIWPISEAWALRYDHGDKNMSYFAATRNGGFNIMPVEITAYRRGPKPAPFEFRGTC